MDLCWSCVHRTGEVLPRSKSFSIILAEKGWCCSAARLPHHTPTPCHRRRLAFWWSNVMQLRWMVWALQHPGGAAGAAGNGAEAGGGLMEESSYEAGWLAEVGSGAV